MSETAKTTRLKMKCPHCENLLDVTEIESGRKVLCIRCENVTVVPNKRTTTRRILNPAAQSPAPAAAVPPPAPTPPRPASPAPAAKADEEAPFDSSWLDAVKEDSGDSSGASPPQLAQIDLDAEAKAEAERAETNRAVGGLRPRVTKSDGQWVDWKSIRDKSAKK